jgi:universal stress protein E
MSRDNRILVVVDPTSAVQPAIERGFALARQLACPLELLICHYDSRFSGKRLFAGQERAQLRENDLQHQLGYLRSIAAEHAEQADVVAVRAVWDTPLAEGIIRECLRCEPAMVLKDTHHHNALSRTLFTNTDWQLIRDCPVPLWLVKGGAMPSQKIMAAVDPLNENDKPASLDKEILAQAAALVTAMSGELHIYHAYDAMPAIAKAGALAMSPTPVPVAELNAKVKHEHAAAFDELIAGLDLPPGQQHLMAGSVVDTLPALSRQLQAGLVVLGSLARSRLKQAVVGSTAERILEHMACDLLIVKPPGFRSEVTYRAQASDFQSISDST